MLKQLIRSEIEKDSPDYNRIVQAIRLRQHRKKMEEFIKIVREEG